MNRKLYMVAVAVLLVGVMWRPALAEVSTAEQPRIAAWEHEASVWAIEANKKALAAQPEQREKIRTQLESERGEPLAAGIAEANTGRPFVVFQRSMPEFIMRLQAPSADEAGVKTLSATVAKDQWADIQVGIWALKDIKGLSYSVSDLVHSDVLHKIDASKDVRALYNYNLWTPVTKKKKRNKRAQKPSVDGDIVVGEKVEFGPKWHETPCVIVDLPSVDVAANEA